MKYERQVHTGTTDQQILGYLREAASILTSGYLRMHAQDREMERIHRKLKGDFGILMLVGAEEDEGFILGVKDHDGCRNETVCRCKALYRVRIQ